MRFVGAALALACAGCLSEPDFPVAEGQPFPPATAVAVRSAAVGDLNGDSAPDLVLGSDPGPEDRGLFLLFGGASGWQGTFHGFLPTPEVPPFTAHAQDLDGDQRVDLTVLGPTGVEEATLVAYLGVAAGGTTFTPGRVRIIDTVPVSAGDPRAYIIPLRLDDDADVDLILGQFRWEAAVEIDRLDESFIDVPVATLPRAVDDGDSTAAATAVRDGASGVDDLLIARFDRTVHHANPGGIEFPDTGTVMLLSESVGHARAGFFDLDGDQRPDSLGFGAGRMSALVTDLAAPRFYWNSDYYEGMPTWFHLADLDDDGAPEMIVTQTVPIGTQLLMFAGIRIDEQVDPPELARNVREPLDLPDFVVAAGAAADFDGDGVLEAVLVAADGEIRCLQVRVAGVTPCP